MRNLSWFVLTALFAAGCSKEETLESGADLLQGAGPTKELDIHGAHLSPHTYPVAIRMLEDGLLPIEEIVTQRMPLADFQRGIDLVASGATSIKVTLEP